MTVESHPRLVGERTWRFRDRLAPSLEVAMGLETAHPDALARLNKGCTSTTSPPRRAALAAHGVGLRVFLLVHPPFVPRDERTPWLLRSIDVGDRRRRVRDRADPDPRRHAARWRRWPAAGAVRAAVAGRRSKTRRRSAIGSRGRSRARVLADLWDLAAFAACAACLEARRARLLRLNLEQRVPDSRSPAPRAAARACRRRPDGDGAADDRRRRRDRRLGLRRRARPR